MRRCFVNGASGIGALVRADTLPRPKDARGRGPCALWLSAPRGRSPRRDRDGKLRYVGHGCGRAVHPRNAADGHNTIRHIRHRVTATKERASVMDHRQKNRLYLCVVPDGPDAFFVTAQVDEE